MTDWTHQFPSTSVTRTYKGDQNLGRQYDADGTKLLYELKNQMTFNNLGQLKMTRLFTDGTVITCWSHFGYDHIDIDVTSRVGVSCTITLINLPDAIPPMKNNGQVAEGEVEGVDYIKTYYIADTARCPECPDPDFSICTTDELDEDEALCTPFTFENASYESKEGEPNNHCLDPSDHCQAEIIDSGEDSGGTYIIWKAYTEWPPDEAEGYGYMQMKGWFRIEGQIDDVCTSIPVVIRVDCCEKNSDEYMEAHPDDWGDLDIEYTSLVMGFNESQTLTALNGCPPFVWTLVSGGGTLTPSEDTLTALYESPGVNPDCVYNPIIKLEDRCENTKELKLAINGNPYGIAYWQTTYVYAGLSPIPTVPNCRQKVTWYNCDGTITESPYNPCDGNYLQPCLGGCGSIVPGLCEGYGCNWRSDPNWCAEFGNSAGCTDPTRHWICIFCSTWSCSQTTKYCADCAGGGEIDYHGHACDKRNQAMKDGGCCPLNPETGLPF